MVKKQYADIIDVANLAGVSPATVSRCFNHPNMVQPATRKRIQDAVEQTGYIRNRAAQAIHGRRSGTVGLIVPTLDNAIFANLIQAFSEQLSEEGFTMLVATHGYDLGREYQLLRSLLEHRVEGVGLIGLDHKDETFALIERRETPAVAMWNYRLNTRMPCVGADNYQAGRLIADHILSLGHHDIALVFPDGFENDRAASRFSGVMDVLSEAGLKPSQGRIISTIYSIKNAREASEPLFATENRPTAIIAGNDVIAQGVIFGAHAQGLSVPHDVSVAGIGDFSGSAHFVPSLTTVKMRSRSIGLEAARMLVGTINGPDQTPETNVLIASELRARDSTGPLKIK